MSLYDSAVAELEAWTPPTEAQSVLRTAYLAHLHEHPDGLSRDCHPDHLTAGLLVVNEARDRVLLNLHAKYRIWVQFGGHCEPTDDSLVAVALREGLEESGIEGLTLVGEGLAHLDRHEVRCGPIRPAHHLDVRYIAVAPPGAEPVVSSESLDVRWFDLVALPDGLEDELHELIATARRA